MHQKNCLPFIWFCYKIITIEVGLTMELDPDKVRYYYERGLKYIYQQQEDE